MATPAPGLEPGEQLLARAPVSFRGATAASVRSTFAMSSARKRMAAYDAWRAQADTMGFTTAGPEMVLGVTDARLVVWRTTFWLNRPESITGKMPLARILDVATARHGAVTSMALALDTGEIVEVEALRGRRLRALAATLRDALAAHRR